jgi:proteasome lid subunit RPN8/RPN11
MENDFLLEAKKHALKYKNEEACGLVIQSENNKIFLKSKNISLSKIESFAIDPLCYLRAKEYGKIVGCFHSHIKNLSFSFHDISNSYKHNLIYYLYNTKNDKFYTFDPKENEIYKKYINLEFKLGTNDCGSLIYNFYKNELGIEAPIKPIFDTTSYDQLKSRNLHIWDQNIIYKKNAELFNLLDLKRLEDLKLYDIIVFKDENKTPTHGALFLDQELILHQRINSISTIESFRKGHSKYISYILRHKKYA